MLFISGSYSDTVNRSGGIDVPPAFYKEINFEGGDLGKFFMKEIQVI